ncbi:uncharacterized protein LOC129306502 isoform X2 [Prosopis cineraria]|uniref:uncharacterized protein LOC129306502 isoform X2 n=1 Tax=Prosopis cineraria TaxID=364024 RepID=UPI00240EF491|nr:uncharacterized protein LOC129306502 isoform X2 [Prosopis cineraria]
MRLVSLSQAYIFLSVILLLLLVTPLSHALWKRESDIKEAVFLSPKFVLGPGSVENRYYYGIDFPRGHVALKSFNGEVIDEEGNPVPLHETYLHHWAVMRYHQRKGVIHTGSESHSDHILVANSGLCPDTAGQYFGLGSETRGTATKIPDPFGIEIGNPEDIPDEYEEKWMLNVHAIDTRGVEDRLGCTECKCDLYNITMDEYGRPVRPDYLGGLLCCYHNTQCRVKEGFERPRRSLYLRYTVKWVDWSDLVVPVKIYVLDVTDTLQVSIGSKALGAKHHCKIEYDVEPCGNNHRDSTGCIDVKRTSLPMPRGGYVIYGVAHQHAGGTGSTLYGQDGRVICSSTPSYGTGKEAGNEEGYIVGMTTCYPQPGSVKIIDGEIVTVESNYSRSSRPHTGVMGLFYLLVAEQLPDQLSRHSSGAPLFANIDNMFY